jgi:hypothetical protein
MPVRRGPKADPENAAIVGLQKQNTTLEGKFVKAEQVIDIQGKGWMSPLLVSNRCLWSSSTLCTAMPRVFNYAKVIPSGALRSAVLMSSRAEGAKRRRNVILSGAREAPW